MFQISIINSFSLIYAANEFVHSFSWLFFNILHKPCPAMPQVNNSIDYSLIFCHKTCTSIASTGVLKNAVASPSYCVVCWNVHFDNWQVDIKRDKRAKIDLCTFMMATEFKVQEWFLACFSNFDVGFSLSSQAHHGCFLVDEIMRLWQLYNPNQ